MDLIVLTLSGTVFKDIFTKLAAKNPAEYLLHCVIECFVSRYVVLIYLLLIAHNSMLRLKVFI